MTSALSSRVFLVTGSTDGIGLHTAKRLASAGSTVLIHGRSEKRVLQSVADTKRAGKHDRVHGFVHDLASLSGVCALAADVRSWLDMSTTNAGPGGHKLDLINNAGVFEAQYQQTPDGFERTWAINVLAPFLLTHLLLDHVNGHIINVASISAGSSFDFDNLNQEKGFSAHNAYSLSKLAMIAFTLALSKKLDKHGIKVNCLDPGTVSTKMLSAGWGMSGIPVSTADSEYKLITDPTLANMSGQYLVGNRPQHVPSAAANAHNQDRLWKLWEEQTGIIWP